MVIRPPFKIHGGKFYLSKFIVSHLPDNYQKMTYLEPFCGACNVLLRKDISSQEIVSDIDRRQTTLLQYIKFSCKRLQAELRTLDYSEDTLKKFQKRNAYTDDIFIAVTEFVLKRMSRGGLGQHFSWQNRLRGGRPGSINEWYNAIENLSIVSQRLENVQIHNIDFRDILNYYNNDNTVAYLDPPYLQGTRSATSCYKFEMSDTDHIDLLNIIISYKGKVMISGYPSELYNNILSQWNRYEKETINHSGQGKKKAKRIECIWTNY